MGYLVIKRAAGRIRIVHDRAFNTNLQGQGIVFFTTLADILFYVPHVNAWLNQVSQTDMDRSQKISTLVHQVNFTL